MKRILLTLTVVHFLVGCLESKTLPPVQELSSVMPSVTNPVQPVTPITQDPGVVAKSIFAQSAMPLGSRYFIASVFRNGFTRSDMTASDHKALNDIFDQTLNKGADVFGGALDFYSTRGMKENIDASCTWTTCSSEAQTKVPLNLPSSPGRSNALGNTCKRVLDNYLFFKAGLQNIGLTVNGTAVPPFDESKIQNIYEIFYLGETIEPEIKEAILMSIEESKYLSYGALDQWRLAFMLICQTPYWQIL